MIVRVRIPEIGWSLQSGDPFYAFQALRQKIDSIQDPRSKNLRIDVEIEVEED